MNSTIEKLEKILYALLLVTGIGLFSSVLLGIGMMILALIGIR